MLDQKQILTSEESKWLYNESLLRYEKDYIFETNPEKMNHSRFKTVEEHLVRDLELTTFLTDKLKCWDLNKLYEFKVMRYGEGGYFKKHIDGGNTHPNRFRTIIIQLSDNNEYDGGNLLIEDTKVRRAIGNGVIFKPNQEHELTTITRGERKVLVAWIYKHSFNNSTTVI